MREPAKFKLFVAAIVAGTARWEPLGKGGTMGEIYTLGLRHCTEIDFRGLPIIGDHAAEQLRRSLPKRKSSS